MYNKIVSAALIIAILSIVPLHAEKENGENTRKPVKLDPGLTKRVLMTIYGGGAFSFPWGALHFTGNPKTDVDYGYNAGVRVACPLIWWAGPIAGIEYSMKPVSVTSVYPTGRVTRKQALQTINLLVGWRQYVWYFFYGTGVFAGLNLGSWSSSVHLNGLEYSPGPFGKDINPFSNSTFGIYTEIGFMIVLSKNISLDVTSQLQGSVVQASLFESRFGSSSYKPMALFFTAGITVRFR